MFLDTDADGDTFDDDVIFDPTICGTATPPENTDIAVDVAASLVRFNDDAGANCAASQGTFAAVRAPTRPRTSPGSSSRRATRAATTRRRSCAT